MRRDEQHGEERDRLWDPKPDVHDAFELIPGEESNHSPIDSPEFLVDATLYGEMVPTMFRWMSPDEQQRRAQYLARLGHHD